MYDDVMDTNDTGLLELTVRLESYAAAHLTPTALGAGRTRANVMNAAHRRATLMAAGVTADGAHEPLKGVAIARRRPMQGAAWRRAGAALAAASLALAMVAGTAYGAKAGGPLYATRLWVEEANLPADALPRAHAEVDRLDARLAEAQQASADGDGPAVEAALSAYSAILIEAFRGAAGDPAADAAILFSLTRHVMVLTGLAGTVPLPARLAVQQALTSSSKVLDDVDSAPPQGNGGRPSDPDGSGAGAIAPKPVQPAGPTQGSGPAPAAGGDVKEKPNKSAPPEKRPSGGDGTPAPGPSRGAGRGPTTPPAHPSADPSVRDVKPTGPGKDGGS
jgi:hypothetical protein